jgi:hypothetical protein
MAIFVDEVPTSSLRNVQVDLSFRLGEPVGVPPVTQGETPQSDAVLEIPLGWDEIVVLLNSANKTSIANPKQLQALFSGQITRWEELNGPESPVQVWVFPEGEEPRQIFDTAILGEAKNTSLAGIAPDPVAMLEAISKDVGAIGYLPLSWITADSSLVRSIRGISPGLLQPILALADKPPEGIILVLLNCLQGEEGQAVIQKRYQTLPK